MYSLFFVSELQINKKTPSGNVTTTQTASTVVRTTQAIDPLCRDRAVVPAAVQHRAEVMLLDPAVLQRLVLEAADGALRKR